MDRALRARCQRFLLPSSRTQTPFRTRVFFPPTGRAPADSLLSRARGALLQVGAIDLNRPRAGVDLLRAKALRRRRVNRPYPGLAAFECRASASLAGIMALAGGAPALQFVMPDIAENLERVRSQIAEAAKKAAAHPTKSSWSRFQKLTRPKRFEPRSMPGNNSLGKAASRKRVRKFRCCLPPRAGILSGGCKKIRSGTLFRSSSFSTASIPSSSLAR